MEFETKLTNGKTLISGQDDNGLHYGIIRDDLGFIESMTLTDTVADVFAWAHNHDTTD